MAATMPMPYQWSDEMYAHVMAMPTDFCPLLDFQESLLLPEVLPASLAFFEPVAGTTGLLPEAWCTVGADAMLPAKVLRLSDMLQISTDGPDADASPRLLKLSDALCMDVQNVPFEVPEPLKIPSRSPLRLCDALGVDDLTRASALTERMVSAKPTVDATIEVPRHGSVMLLNIVKGMVCSQPALTEDGHHTPSTATSDGEEFSAAAGETRHEEDVKNETMPLASVRSKRSRRGGRGKGGKGKLPSEEAHHVAESRPVKTEPSVPKPNCDAVPLTGRRAKNGERRILPSRV